MHDEFIVRHRQRLKHHFVNTSKVLLYGYRSLSDAAKITYQVIDGFDWEDKETGASKGFAFPAAETIARIRATTVRTVQRHISELEAVGLLTRTRRKHRASVLYIEDVSQAEIERYLALFVDRPQANNRATGDDGSDGDGGPSQGGGAPSASGDGSEHEVSNDKSVVSAEPAQTTKMSLVYKEEKEEKKKNVNAEKSERRGLQSMQALIQRHTINAPTKRQSRGVRSERKERRDYLAQTLADTFHDADGLGCYRRIADKLPETIVYQLMAEVKESVQLGRVHTSSAALFVAAAKHYARKHNIALGFKNDVGNTGKHLPADGP